MPEPNTAVVVSRPLILSPAERQLLRLMQQLQYGDIYGLRVREGQPDPDSMLEIVQRIKVGDALSSPAATPKSRDSLKQRVLALLEIFSSLGEGVILHLEVQAGLPFRIAIPHRMRLGEDADGDNSGSADQKSRTAPEIPGYLYNRGTHVEHIHLEG